MKPAAEIQKKIGAFGDLVVVERRENKIELGIDDRRQTVARNRIGNRRRIAFLFHVEHEIIHAHADLRS